MSFSKCEDYKNIDHGLVHIEVKKNMLKKFQKPISDELRLLSLKNKQQFYRDLIENPKKVDDIIRLFSMNVPTCMRLYGPLGIDYVYEANKIGKENIHKITGELASQAIIDIESEIYDIIKR